jgi:hypothetical protein
VGHGRRQLLWFAVTRHPTAEWLAQQIVEAFPWDTAPAYLVRDNDAAYGQAFRRRIRAMGIRDRPISPRSPWQNPYAERLIGTLRRDCLDHVLIFGALHLRRILTSYSRYYNETRTTRMLRSVERSSDMGLLRCADSVRAALLLRADMIFGKDSHRWLLRVWGNRQVALQLRSGVSEVASKPPLPTDEWQPRPRFQPEAPLLLSSVVMMQSAQDRQTEDAAGRLDSAR